MIVDLTLLAGTQIQLSGVLEERFKARDLHCPQAARAVPLVSQNDKVESSRSAEQILGSGKSSAVREPARAVPLVCQNDKVESSRSAEKILGSGEKYRCPRTRHYNSLHT